MEHEPMAGDDWRCLHDLFDLVYHRSGDAGTMRQIGQGPTPKLAFDPDPRP
jgi:hypothetical protein